jgi:hypothetical protein
MNKKIQIILIAAIVVIAGVVLFDSLSTRVNKLPDNPFEYNIDEFRAVHESMISYREIRQITIDSGEPTAFAIHNENICLLTQTHMTVLSPNGRQLWRKNIEPGSKHLAFTRDGRIIIAYPNYLVLFDSNGEEVTRSTPTNQESHFTAVAIADTAIFVADAGNKEIVVFNSNLEQVNSFRGESGVSALHGFILPSLHFHLAINHDDELWVVNPGMHRLQNYAYTGRLRGDWGKPSFGHDGFSGCCNPGYFAFLSDGRFVTSEKGLVRVKIVKESGELESIAAPPSAFPSSEKAPAVAVDGEDNIWLLDFDKKMLRLFKSL